MKEPRLLATFGKPFKFQVAAFRLRLADMRDTARWTDLWQSEHDRAFMVAGATKAGILADLATAVDKAIAQGTGYEAFKKDFRKIIAEKGWLLSPAGQGKDGKGAWRARLIYRTNMSTSYAAGRMAQLVAGNYPFWVYRHGASLEPREQHLAWDGLILPPDHPFWVTHAPPNGWGCSCYVVGARSMAAAKILGGKPDLKLPDNWQALDPRTGAPIGIDKGWAYSPGTSVASTVAALAPKLEVLPPKPSVDLIQSWLGLDAFSTWLSAPSGFWPMARIEASDAARIGSTQVIAKLSSETAAKQLREHPELSALDYLMVQRVVDTATERFRDSPNSMVFVVNDPGAGGYVLVVKATLTGKELFVTSYRRISADAAQADRTLRRLRARALEE